MTDETDNTGSPRLIVWGLRFLGIGLVGLLGAIVYFQSAENIEPHGKQSKQNNREISEDDFEEWMNSDGEHGAINQDTGHSQTATDRTSAPAYQTLRPALRRGLGDIDLDYKFPKVSNVEFSLRRMAGDTVHLSEFRGKWVLINFWATWCIPCREEMPALENLDSDLPSARFQLLAVNLKEPESKVRSFLESEGLSLDVLLDRRGTVASRYHVRAVPVSWLVNPEGRIIGRLLGPREWDQPPVRDVFRDLVNTS